GTTSADAASGASRRSSTRFLRTSTWIVRLLPLLAGSAARISVVCRRVSVLPAQVIEQAGLVLLGELIAGFLGRDPCRRELLEERRGRHLEFACELLDRHLGHACLRCAAVVA